MTKTYVIDVFNAGTGEFDQGTVTLEIQTYTIGFLQSRRHAGNILATFCNPAIPKQKKNYRQQIVVLPRYFYRIVPEAAGLGFAGCVDVTADQLWRLGFIFPDEDGGRTATE